MEKEQIMVKARQILYDNFPLYKNKPIQFIGFKKDKYCQSGVTICCSDLKF